MDFLFNDFQIFLLSIFGWQSFPQRMDEDVDAGQGISDLMGNARG
jgi:hypothetical protein